MIIVLEASANPDTPQITFVDNFQADSHVLLEYWEQAVIS